MKVGANRTMKDDAEELLKIREDCFNLDAAFIEWLGKRLPVYLEDAVIDLDYHTFEYNGQTKTQREMIIELISKMNYYLSGHDCLWKKEDESNYDEIFRIWTMIAPSMWW